MGIQKFLKDHQWMHSPSFLTKDQTEWPKTLETSRILPSGDPEVKSQSHASVLESLTEPVMARLLSYFSDWTKLKRTVGWILVANENLKARVAARKKDRSGRPAARE